MSNYLNDYKKLIKSELKKQSKYKLGDKDKKICKICGILKTRIFNGYFDTLNRRWIGEDNLLWNGRTCGECHQNKMAAHQRKKRSEQG